MTITAAQWYVFGKAKRFGHPLAEQKLAACRRIRDSQGTPRLCEARSDRSEPVFWLEPVRLARNTGFRSHELNQVQHLIEQNQQRLLESWDEYFNE